MRPYLIEKQDGYIGKLHDHDNPQMVVCGQEQEMVFPMVKVDCKTNGPWWMNENERKHKRKDKTLDGEEVTNDKTKQQLLMDLCTRRVALDNYDASKWTYPSLVKICKRAKPPISLTITTPKIIKGWQGKPKCLLQILWEHSFID